MDDTKTLPVASRLTPSEIALVDAHAKRATSRFKFTVTRSTAIAMLVREGLQAIERAEAAS